MSRVVKASEVRNVGNSQSQNIFYKTKNSGRHKDLSPNRPRTYTYVRMHVRMGRDSKKEGERNDWSSSLKFSLFIKSYMHTYVHTYTYEDDYSYFLMRTLLVDGAFSTLYLLDFFSLLTSETAQVANCMPYLLHI